MSSCFSQTSKQFALNVLNDLCYQPEFFPDIAVFCSQLWPILLRRMQTDCLITVVSKNVIPSVFFFMLEVQEN